MITVVGLAGAGNSAELLSAFPSAKVVARAAHTLERFPIEHSYDELFESDDLAKVADFIAQDLLARSGHNDVVYIVPGRGDAGDATVEALAAATSIVIRPTFGRLQPSGQLQMVDALALATAEHQLPFDAGQTPVDPTVPLIVSNWMGRQVPELATRRLRRVYGTDVILRPNRYHEVWIAALPFQSAGSSLSGLAAISAHLRSPDGCPWDREQTIATMTESIVDEVGELADAVAVDDVTGQIDELGDVLMNLMLITQIAHEHGSYSLEDVVTNVAEKMIRRHPHVFGELEVNTVDEVLRIWQKVKAGEGQGEQ